MVQPWCALWEGQSDIWCQTLEPIEVRARVSCGREMAIIHVVQCVNLYRTPYKAVLPAICTQLPTQVIHVNTATAMLSHPNYNAKYMYISHQARSRYRKKAGQRSQPSYRRSLATVCTSARGPQTIMQSLHPIAAPPLEFSLLTYCEALPGAPDGPKKHPGPSHPLCLTFAIATTSSTTPFS